MATMASIENWLMEHCTLDKAQGCAEGTGLNRLHQRVFGHKKNVNKAKAAHELAAFYADARNIINLWSGNPDSLSPEQSLSEAEKAFVAIIVQYNGREFKPTSKKIAAEFGLEFKKPEHGYSSYSSRDPFDSSYSSRYYYLTFLHLLTQYDPQTKAVVFFPGGKEMPYFLLETLRQIIPPFEYKYSAYTPVATDRLICREGRVGDYASIISFCSGEHFKVKQDTYDITKAKLAKIVEALGFEEVCDKAGKFCSPKEATRTNDFKIALPMFVLSATIGLIDIDRDGVVTPGKKSVELLSGPPHILAKKLFESYAAKNRIYETHYITYIAIRDGESWIRWEESRKAVVELLKTCPVETWIAFQDFEKYMMIFHGDFFRKLLNCAVFIQGYNFGYGYGQSDYPDWDECDVQIIRLIFSFLSAIGMLDIAYTQSVRRFKVAEDDLCVGIAGFRITPLGAWILGLTPTYKTANNHVLRSEEGGLIVQPDHTIVISGLKSRIEHETYLSRFLTKVSSDDHVSVYMADFQSMIRAYNQGIEPQEIEAYLTRASARPLTDNVIRSFSGWQSKVGKVRIRTVTILESGDPLVLQELVHAKGMEKLLGDEIQHAVRIEDEGGKARVKSIAEKNGWLVEVPSAQRGKGN